MANHADLLDKANEVAQMYADEGLRAVQLKNRPEQIQNEDGTWPITECVECDIDIPAVRLALGRVRCVHCQEEKEKKQRVQRN